MRDHAPMADLLDDTAVTEALREL
ncbi:MAG: hypothetical protein QOD96_4605, partial [Pseudonocardiales bacterium]|nr:hypothetical protein [Pseudonocardiales bacterium]